MFHGAAWRAHAHSQAWRCRRLPAQHRWHRTEIPDTATAAGGLSVSLARDIFVGRQPAGEDAERVGGQLVDNFVGLYAAADIAKGTVVLTEAEMPEAELPRVARDPCAACMAELPLSK